MDLKQMRERVLLGVVALIFSKHAQRAALSKLIRGVAYIGGALLLWALAR